MAEISFMVEFVCWQLASIRNRREQRTLERLKLPILGCAVALVAGCSSFGSHQAAAPNQAASSGMAPLQMQAQNPDTRPPKWEFTIPDQPSVQTWVRRFSSEKHGSFQAQLDRARYYLVPAEEIFKQHGLPPELAYVALIESGFTPKARSRASAVGMFQFISATGKRYGLEQNKWIDERCHPMKSANAAAGYFSFLYDTFGSWPLALAAYNAGEKGVQTALDQSGLRNFWDLAQHGYLPAETRDYVPKVLAAVKISRNPSRYGFRFDPQLYVKRHETVQVPGGVKLSWLEKHTGVPERQLESCNPELCKPMTPPGCSNYDLCVPLGKGEDILSALAIHPINEEKAEKRAAAPAPAPHKSLAAPAPARAAFASYKIQPGDSLFGLARKHNCSAKELASLNGMSPSQPLRIGGTIKIPATQTAASMAAPPAKASKTKVQVASAAGRKKTPALPQKTREPIYYPVRQGDTLWSIAERFQISVKTLCTQNELKPNQKLIPGSRLAIYKEKPQVLAKVTRRRGN